MQQPPCGEFKIYYVKETSTWDGMLQIQRKYQEVYTEHLTGKSVGITNVHSVLYVEKYLEDLMKTKMYT